MDIKKYPSEGAVNQALEGGEPLLAVIFFDGEEAIVAPADDVLEHHILLMEAGHSDRDIDKVFRVVIDKDGADWTFVCPPDYKGIQGRQRRIATFYQDGFAAISGLLSELGLMVGIDIPRRYRRHLEALGE